MRLEKFEAGQLLINLEPTKKEFVDVGEVKKVVSLKNYLEAFCRE